jgi:hypothetical protein
LLVFLPSFARFLASLCSYSCPHLLLFLPTFEPILAYPINLQWLESSLSCRRGKACGWVMRHPKRTSKETRLVRTYLL